MTRIYIEAYRADGSQILGNLDGQASLACRNYKRTLHYQRLLFGRHRPMHSRVHHWKVTRDNSVLEIIENKWRNEL